MAQKKIALLYRDDLTGTDNFEIIQCEFDAGTVCEYQCKHPTRTVRFALPLDQDMIESRDREQADFIEKCHAYGFEPSDYRRPFKAKPNGHTCELLGFIPSRRKYKVRFYDHDLGRPLLCTVTYAHAMLP